MKINLLCVLFALVATPAFAQNEKAAHLRVACLGDSITFGARVERETESYPARLRVILGEGCEVGNFGLGSATLLKSGRPNVWKRLPEAMAFKPDVVVISLGTNDTVSGKRANWEKIDRFEADFGELIEKLAGLETQPRIVLCTPTPMVLETPGLSADRLAQLTERKPRLKELCERIRKLVVLHASKNVSLLELNPLLDHKPALITDADGVHPNVQGYLVVAKAVADHIRSE